MVSLPWFDEQCGVAPRFLMSVDRCSFQVDVRILPFLMLFLFRISSCFLALRVVYGLGISMNSVELLIITYLYGSGKFDVFINAYTDDLELYRTSTRDYSVAHFTICLLYTSRCV